MNRLLNRLVFRFSSEPPSGENFNPFEKPSFAKLTNRSLIIIEGPETKKFLQTLTTNDVNKLFVKDKTIKRASIYSLFLSPQGKIISDAFIFRPLK